MTTIDLPATRSHRGDQPRAGAVLHICHLCLFEEVLVYSFQDEGFLHDDAAIMFDHEGGELGAVDEDKARIDPLGVVAGIRAETRRGDEDPAAGLRAMQCPDEGLDVRAADMPVGVALGLDVHDVEPQLVQADEPVEASVARGAQVLGGCLQAPVSIFTSNRSTSCSRNTGGCLRTRASRSAATAEWAESITSSMASRGERSRGRPRRYRMAAGPSAAWSERGTPHTPGTGSRPSC
jgi:hypothetical protein